MQRLAFARALRFLSYLPAAKWTALVASVAAGVFFVFLLALLALFADLIVNRGAMPMYPQLPPRLQAHHATDTTLSDDPPTRKAALDRWRDGLGSVGIQDADVHGVVLSDAPEQLTASDQQRRLETLWLIEMPAWLDHNISQEAGDLVRAELRHNVRTLGVERALVEPIPDYGILSLAIRTKASLQNWFIAPLARWNSWMWRWGNAYYLQGLFFLALILAAIRMALIFTANYAAARATLEAVTRLRRAVYHHTHRLGNLAVRALGPSEAVSVSTRHLEVVHDGLFAWLTVYFREPVKFGLLLLFAMAINFWLALTFLLFAILVWMIGGQIAAYFRRHGRIASHRAANQMALIQESLMMMRLVKVYLMELFNQARIERQLSTYAQAQLQRYRGEAIYRPLFAFLGTAAAVVLLLLAGTVVLNGELGVTSAMVMVTALACLYWPMVRWLDARRTVRRSRDSAKVLFGFLDRPGSVGQAIEAEFLPPMAKALEFDKVVLNEPGTGRKLLRGVSFTIRAGQKVAIVGPEPMEKHALVYLIPRFLDPGAGEVRIDRKNLRWVTLDSLRVQTAMVLQHNLVFNDTVGNNIGCGDPAYTLPKIIEAAKIAHAHHFIQKLPQGYETMIGEQGHALSEGEKFRIALARAIIREPALLIIEESPTPLDEDNKAMVDDTYARILQDRTVIFLPHRLSTIKNCDQVLLLYEGKIAAVGEHRELLATNDLYRHLQYLEFNEFGGLAPATVADGAA
jgi:ATP-binding cassette, subfamily B, bacterial